MARYFYANGLTGKGLVSTQGEELGAVKDIAVNELTGKLEKLVIEPSSASPGSKSVGEPSTIPFEAVLDAKDLVIIDSRRIPKRF